MLQFVFTNILMISLGAILYLGARALPRLAEEDANERAYSLIERWVMSDIPHRIDRAVNNYAGKLFRKLKVFLLRFDNYLTEKLKKLNTQATGITGKAKVQIDLGDVREVKTDSYTGPDRRRENGEGMV